ncbi:uncharacterized protein haspin isoform X2 [Sphaeramia orbicularis]|uniref:uncharacterized protein haspin isoform X2 n=1 Tax=Sphaeramia orbicularis TaxID=375764 RepID=UPI00117F61F3|nr:serine/threonine-protein kinase haspin isoform X2 [Sphaeramia orbicularis]
MKPAKPLILKTYGRQRTKLPGWFLPENRKQAFDSTTSSEGDVSIFEPAKPTKTSRRNTVASRKTGRLAKKKAMTCLTVKSVEVEEEEDDESVIILPQAVQHSKTTRAKRTGDGSNRAVRLAKRKAKSALTESSDEENISMPPPLHPQPAQWSRTTREKTRSVSGVKGVQPARRRAKLCLTDKSSDENVHPQFAQQSKATRGNRFISGVFKKQKDQKVTSESEEDMISAAKWHRSKIQRDTNVRVPSVGRFVTRRRCAISTKPRLPKTTVSVLNSSDDFTSGGGTFGSSVVVRLSRQKVHSYLVSSRENSINALGSASLAKVPLREISLNESTDHSLGPCSRKPIFCSTPSAASLRKRPRLTQFPSNDQSSNSPSISVSCIAPLGTFQEDLDSLTPMFSPLHSVQVVVASCNEKKQSSLGKLHKELGLHHHEEPSADLFMEMKNTDERSNCGEAPKSHEEDLQPRKGWELPRQSLLSTGSDSSSHFMSTTGGLEWLIELLKEKCLTQHCTVQLERLEFLTVTQLCSQTTFSSCLGSLSPICSPQTKQDPPSVSSGHTIELLQSSEPLVIVVNSDNLHLGTCSKSPVHDVLTDGQSTDLLLSDDCKQSAENISTKESMETSGLYVESTCHTDSSADFVTDVQLPADSCFPVQALFTDPHAEEVAKAVKKKCLTKKCILNLKKLSQVQLKRFMQHKDAALTCDKSVEPESGKSENDHTPVRQSNNDSRAASQLLSNEAEGGGEVVVLEKVLRENCLSDRLSVEIKRMSPMELKDILHLRDPSGKLPADMSDSVTDDQTRNESDCTAITNHCSKNTSKKKGNSTTSEDKTSSDEDLSKSSDDTQPREKKKTSLGPKEKKRRSISTDRPGTTRKACISGLSVSRWKNKDVFRSRTAQRGATKTVDCSINELISTQHRQPREQFGSTMNFSTPVKGSNLNLSSLLADLTPNTQTWSRLKAALSVHRKGMVIRTPRSLHLSVATSTERIGLVDLSQDLFATPRRTPLPKQFQSQLLSNDSEVVCEDEDLSDAEKVYAECGQQGPLPWEECILPPRMKQCVKIGEGTFGEVFSTTNASGDIVALKIIPVEGSERVNGEDQKTFGEILHEIIISKELSSLKDKQQNQTCGFIGLNDLHCVRGCYPSDFLNAWDIFDQQKGSENDRPDFFEKEQLFIILEFEFGGSDLENSNGTLASLGAAKSILHQVTAALAVAEQELHFEHRDLHWGNVLVKTTKQKKASFLLNGTAHSLETKGLLIRIIDYSLSRLEIDDLTVSCDISKDEELFMGQGDYQFEIYRLMRQENGNNWSDYHPHSNVLWLHYLCSKLLSMKYRGSGGRSAKDMREELTRFYDNVLQYSSATEALQNCPMFQ